VIASVGPVMNATLAEYGLTPDVVPPVPKMAVLVRSAAEMVLEILTRKRRAPAQTPANRRGECRDAVTQ
jgi:hypothetical protein